MRFLPSRKRALLRIEVFLIFLQDIRPSLPPLVRHPGAALKREAVQELNTKSIVHASCIRMMQKIPSRPKERRATCHQPSQDIDDG
jgi:hypothetical protein